MDHRFFQQQDQVSTPYRRIGAGFCGSVWSDPDLENIDSTSIAIKREDGAPGRSLSNDHEMHNTVLRALPTCPEQIRTCFLIPRCHEFVAEGYSGWETSNILTRFPPGYSACNILITQRIPPIPRHVRHWLIDKYCPSSLVDTIKADVNNSDCIIRPYLGRRRFGQRESSRIRVFSLRNYPLHIDQMADLGLEAIDYCSAIARALAFMHWSANVDANDVEFVLAPAPVTDVDTPQFHSKLLGGHNLWILDFDCCKRITMDDEGIQQAAEAFLRNDPYYPRPLRDNEEDVRMWDHFKATFLEASSIIVKNNSRIPQGLPKRLMDTIERIVHEESMPH